MGFFKPKVGGAPKKPNFLGGAPKTPPYAPHAPPNKITPGGGLKNQKNALVPPSGALNEYNDVRLAITPH